MRVVRVISFVSCTRCSRSSKNDISLNLFSVYDCVNENKIPVCKECKIDLNYTLNFIPVSRSYRTTAEIRMLDDTVIYEQYTYSENPIITIPDEKPREYKVN